MNNVNDDARGNTILFVSHCILNQNAKVRGIATHPGAVRPIVELLLERGVGIYQMPCPEMCYLGAMRWGQVRRGGYQVLGFVMVDGSPVCGLRRTPQPAIEGEMWGGMTRYIPTQYFAPGQGVFCEILRAEAARLGLTDVPFVSTPEVPDAGSFDEALRAIRALLPGG